MNVNELQFDSLLTSPGTGFEGPGIVPDVIDELASEAIEVVDFMANIGAIAMEASAPTYHSNLFDETRRIEDRNERAVKEHYDQENRFRQMPETSGIGVYARDLGDSPIGLLGTIALEVIDDSALTAQETAAFSDIEASFSGDSGVRLTPGEVASFNDIAANFDAGGGVEGGASGGDGGSGGGE